MDTRELIDSIIASEEDSAEKFVSTMEERISDALEVRKVELASGMMGDLEEAKVEQIDELKASTYAAVARERGDEYEGDYKKHSDVLRRATKKFGSKVGGQLANMQAKRNAKSEMQDDQNPDRLAKPYPGYDGPRTSKSGMLNKTAGRILKKQIKDRMQKEEVEQVDEVAKWRNPPRSAMQAALGRGFKRGLGTYVNPLDDKEDKLAKRASISNTKDLKAMMKRDRANEEVEQIDELKKSTLASYATKAARDIRTNTSLERDFEDNKYSALRVANKNSPHNMGVKWQDKDPAKYNQAVKDMETAGGLQKDYERMAKNRIKGIGRAAARLAKEELKPEFAKASKKHPELDRDQNHPDSLKLKAPEELRKNPKFANRKMKEEVEQVDETTGVTNYNPKSQGGTRKKLLATLAKSKSPKHAAAAQKAGATQRELLAAIKMKKEEVEQVDEADKLAGLDYNKGHKLMYKDGKQKIVKTAGSQKAHRAMGWKERHSVRAAMKEDLVNEAGLSDMEKLRLMGDKNRELTMMAMKRFQQVGDINKLSPAHRTLVTKYMQNQAGSLEKVSTGMQRAALRPSKD